MKGALPDRCLVCAVQRRARGPDNCVCLAAAVATRCLQYQPVYSTPGPNRDDGCPQLALTAHKAKLPRMMSHHNKHSNGSMRLAVAALLALAAFGSSSSPTAAAAAAEAAAASAAPAIAGDTGRTEGVASGGTPVVLQGWSGLSSFSPTSLGVCATSALHNEAAFCWGQLLLPGGGSSIGGIVTQRLSNVSAPTAVASGASWRALTTGHYRSAATNATDAWSCGIAFDGAAFCWGSDASGLGLLGAGGAPQSSPSPLPLAEAGPWKGISAGEGFTCALKADGSAWCWGSNAAGALGCGQAAEALPWAAAPCRVESADSWLQVAAGVKAACGIKANGSLWCW